MRGIVTVSLLLLFLAPAPTPAQFDGVADLTLTTAWCTHAGAVLHTGDFNGDGFADLLCRDPRRLWIDYADSAGRLTGTTDWFLDSVWCTHATSSVHLADLNGDGRTDLLCRDPTRLWYDFADAEGHFGAFDGVLDTRFCSEAGATFFLADFNGDRRADLLCRHGTTLRVDYGGAGAAGAPDLIVGFEGLGSEIVAGRPLGAGVHTVARNQGGAPAPGSRVGQSGYMIDVVLSTDTVVPEGFAVVHATFREDTLLRGGRASNTTDLAPRGSARFSAENDEIPADTPPGRYHLCARIDPGQVVREATETNNVTCVPVRVVPPPAPSGSASFDLHEAWDDVAAATAAAYCIAVHPYKPLPAGVEATPEYPAGFTPDNYEVVAHPGSVGAVRRNYRVTRTSTTVDEGQPQHCPEACAEFGRRFEPDYRGVPLHRKVIGAAGLVVITDGLGDLGDNTSMALVDQDFARGGRAIAGARAVMVGDPWHESDVAWADYCCCGLRAR